MESVEQHACGGGQQFVFEHSSEVIGLPMRFGAFVPEQVRGALFFLSGLTCTEQNVITKGHFQAAANEAGLLVICPDTSPRGEGVPNDEAYDLGQGAGFYLDASEEPWAKHFRMRSYLLDELIPLVRERWNLRGKLGITGHSMGGHGALVLGLSNPDVFGSVSAISPISSATRCPWGHKALAAYLGQDKAAWEAQDASLLLERRGWSSPLLVDQGLADGFLDNQLKPELLEAAAAASGADLELRRHEGYDHSYYFISTVMPDHVRHHASQLLERPSSSEPYSDRVR